MAPFRTPRRSTTSSRDWSNSQRTTRSADYELYEEDDEYVLSVELPGFETADITVAWDDGVLNVAADREDDKRGDRTYHRRFRLPKRVADDDITARYENGILEVRLPVETPTDVQGKRIEVTG